MHEAARGVAGRSEEERDVDVVAEEQPKPKHEQRRQQQHEGGQRLGRVRCLLQDAARLHQPLQQPAPQRHSDADRKEANEDRQPYRHVGVHRHLERASQRGHALRKGGRAQVARPHE